MKQITKVDNTVYCKHSAEFSNPLHFAFRGIQLFAWHHWVRTPMI